MAARSVWDAKGASSVPSSAAASSAAPAEESDDEDCCVLCAGEGGVKDLYFVPCGHKSCASCVQRMRVANIYKADKGVRCPFCRQTIESYMDKKPPPKSRSRLQQLTFLGVTSSVPQGTMRREFPRTAFGRRQILSIGEGNDYVAPKSCTGVDGGGLRQTMRGEDLPANYIVPPLRESSDLLAMSMDRTGARHLVYMLREDQPKRDKVAKSLLEALTPSAAKLAWHQYGNFVIQKVVDYAGQHRSILVNGECAFTAIVRSITRNKGLVTTALDQRGTFSLQKMIVLIRGAEELSLIMDSLQGDILRLSCDNFGIYVVERVVEVLITSLNPPPGTKPRVMWETAVEALLQFCQELACNEETARIVAKHQVVNCVLVECIRWTLPRPESTAAALRVAGNARQIAGTKSGNQTLKGILSYNIPEVAELLITSLSGGFPYFALETANQGCKLVRACLAVPSLSAETRTKVVDQLLQATVGSSDGTALLDSATFLDVLAFGLCLLPSMAQEQRFALLAVRLGAPVAQKVKAAVNALRTSESLLKHPPPEPSSPSSQPRSSQPPPSTPSVNPPPSSHHNPNTTTSIPISSSMFFPPGIPPPKKIPPGLTTLKPMINPTNNPSPAVTTSTALPANKSMPIFVQHSAPPPLQQILNNPDPSRPAPPPRNSETPGTTPSVANTTMTTTPGMMTAGAAATSSSTFPDMGSLAEAVPPLATQSEAGPVPSSSGEGGSPKPNVYVPPHLKGTAKPEFPPEKASTSPTIPSHLFPPPTSALFLRGEGAEGGGAAGGGGKGKETKGWYVPSSSRTAAGGGAQNPPKSPGGSSSSAAAIAQEAARQALLGREREGEVAAAQGGRTQQQRRPGMCAVCYDRLATVVLLNCSHLCACSPCGESLTHCPICEARVDSTVCVQLTLSPADPPQTHHAQPPSLLSDRAEVSRPPLTTPQQSTTSTSAPMQNVPFGGGGPPFSQYGSSPVGGLNLPTGLPARGPTPGFFNPVLQLPPQDPYFRPPQTQDTPEAPRTTTQTSFATIPPPTTISRPAPRPYRPVAPYRPPSVFAPPKMP